MMLTVLKAKIQEVRVTESDTNYPGSIAIPEELLIASGIRQFEQVYVNNKTNGNRIITYAVKSKARGFVSVNGAASKQFSKGDIIHILAYAQLQETEVATFQPTLVITDQDNNLVEEKPYALY
jgi:aspartate 1-decarboxylase